LSFSRSLSLIRSEFGARVSGCKCESRAPNRLPAEPVLFGADADASRGLTTFKSGLVPRGLRRFRTLVIGEPRGETVSEIKLSISLIVVPLSLLVVAIETFKGCKALPRLAVLVNEPPDGVRCDGR